LVSASEDCTLKVWDVNKFCSLKEVEGVVNFEPYLTLRGHLSPIFTLSGSDSYINSTLDDIVISGSRNGELKAWKIPMVNTVDSYGTN
jgi:WD40 repeat protein